MPRRRPRLAPLVVLSLLAACASDPAPQVRPWLDTLRTVDLAARTDARGRVDAPGFVHWEQRDEDVSVAVVPGVLATFGSGTQDGADATAVHAGFGALADAGAHLSGIGAADPSAAYAAAVLRFGAGNVGYPVLFPVRGKDPADWPAGVVFPDILVQLRPAFVDAAPRDRLRDRVQAAVDPLGLDVVELRPNDPALCTVRAGGADPAAWIEASRRARELPLCGGTAHPDVVLPVVLHEERPPTDEDPLLALQWHLANNGRDNGVPGADARVLAAWKVLDGRIGREPSYRPLVAVIDPEGVQWRHPDLAHAAADLGPDAVLRPLTDLGWDFRRPEEIPPPTSPDGAYHGTAAAGLIVAERGNGLGGAGVAPFARLLPVRIGGRASATEKAIRFAAGLTRSDHRGADVLSLSFGFAVGVPTPGVVQDALERARDQGRGGLGCVIVASLSNVCVDNFTEWQGALCTVPGVLAVGRSTNWDLWGQSGYGPGMSLLAPSGPAPASRTSPMVVARDASGNVGQNLVGSLDITTTDAAGADGRNANGYPTVPYDNPNIHELPDPDHTALFGGTSAAVPIVAGVAALVLAVDPEMRGADVRFVLRSTARKIDTDGVDAAGNRSEGGLDAATYASTRGHGCVDAVAAVERAIAGGPYGPDDVPFMRRWPGPQLLAPAVFARSDDVRPETTAAADPYPFPRPRPPAGPAPVLLMELTDQGDPVAVGADVTYVVRITNQGTVPAHDMRLVLVVPEGTTIVGVVPPDARDRLDLPTHQKEGRTVRFTPVPSVAPGAVTTYRVTVRATADGDVRCRAEVTCRERPDAVAETEATRIYMTR